MVDGALVHSTKHIPVLGVVLAGGASRRYGSDKALAMLDGTPLLQWVVDRVRPQVDVLAISGTSRMGVTLPIIADAVGGCGPLSALCSILAWAKERNLPLVATFSCDTPFIPRDAVSDLRAALQDCDCAVASWTGVTHPTCALWKTKTHGEIEAAFAAGVRSVHGAIAYLNTSFADFSSVRDGPTGDPFFNINARNDMAVAQLWLEEGHTSHDSA